VNYQTFEGKAALVSVIEHSINGHTGKELLTFQLRYWRAIHSEMLTHRVFSRNASSSRAIPTAKLLEEVRTDAAKPVHWGKNQSGMQAHEECDALVVDPTTGELLTREVAWERAAVHASNWAEAFASAGYHKQIVNRHLEPFSRISVVATATEYENWYELRDHEDAQPDIRDLAHTMITAYEASKPRIVKYKGSGTDARNWHLPYITLEERIRFPVADLLAMSAARCARVSYLTHDKQNPSRDADIGLYERLVLSKPLHASPLEHQAYAAEINGACRNFSGGWFMHRDVLERLGSIQAIRQVYGKTVPLYGTTT
jgi:thymidylate synthase ThyX